MKDYTCFILFPLPSRLFWCTSDYFSHPIFTHITYFFEARFLTSNLASWSFLPNSSSFATKVMSEARPKAMRTRKYCPKATPSSPFSILTSVDLLIPALSAICTVVRFLLNLAYLICSPNVCRIRI